MASPGSSNDYSDLLNDQKFLDWFWDGKNATKAIISLNNHNFRKSEKGADFLRREKHSPTVYGVTISYEKNSATTSTVVRSPAVTPLVEFFNEHSKHLCLMKVGFTHVSSDPKDDNRLEAVRKANAKCDQKAKILFSLPINFVDVTNPREVEKTTRSKLGVKLKTEIANQLGLTEPTEWVITSTELTEYVKNDIIDPEKKKTGKDFRVLTVNVLSKHERQLEKLTKEVVSYLQKHQKSLLS